MAKQVSVSECGGKDWAAVFPEADEDSVEAARNVVASRRAQGLGSGTYEVVIDGLVVGLA